MNYKVKVFEDDNRIEVLDKIKLKVDLIVKHEITVYIGYLLFTIFAGLLSCFSAFQWGFQKKFISAFQLLLTTDTSVATQYSSVFAVLIIACVYLFGALSVLFFAINKDNQKPNIILLVITTLTFCNLFSNWYVNADKIDWIASVAMFLIAGFFEVLMYFTINYIEERKD